jgi:hypothetical protein
MKILELINHRIVENPMMQIFYLETIGDSADKIIPGEFGNISIETRSKVVQLENFQVSSKIGREQMIDLAEFGINIIEQIKSVLVNEMGHGKQKRIIENMEDLGTKSWKKNWTTMQHRLNRWFGYEPLVKVDEESFANSLIRCSREIATASRRGEGEFVILGPLYASLCKCSPGFVSMQETGESATEIVRLGNIGNLKIYLNPNSTWSHDKIVVGRVSGDNEPGLIHLHKEFLWNEYDEAISLEKIISLRERCAVVEIGNAEPNYICKRFTTKKHNIFTFLFKKLVNRIKR